MSILTYIPDNTKMVHKTSVEFYGKKVVKDINLVQYDAGIPIIEVSLYLNGQPYVVPQIDGVKMSVRWSKDTVTNKIVKDVLGCSEDRTKVYFDIDSDMTKQHGTYYPTIELIVPVNGKLDMSGSSPMIFNVNINPVQLEDI